MYESSSPRPHSILCLAAVEGLQGGRKSLAKKIGVAPQTIASWFVKNRLPKHAIMKLVGLSEGKFTAEEFLDDTI